MRAILFALLAVVGQPVSAAPVPKKGPPKQIPAEVVKAWEDAGATFGTL